MASASFSEDLTCSICLSVFTDPVILLCGHSFCRDCISVSLSKQPHCPHCRISVKGQSLLTNHVLKSLAEKTKEATKLKLEYRQEKEETDFLCLEHDEKLKLYCLTDQQLICVICRDGQKHESHKFKPVSEAATLVRTELEDLMKNISADINTLEGLVQSQTEEMNKTKERAQELKSLISRQFKKMHTFLKKRESELNNKVMCDEEDGVNKMTERLNAIEAVIAENKKLQETVTSVLEIQETERFLKTWSEEKEVKAVRSSFQPKGGNFQVEKTHLSVGPYESHLQMFVWKEMLQVIKPREERLFLRSDQTSLIVSQDQSSVFVCDFKNQCYDQSYRQPNNSYYNSSKLYNMKQNQLPSSAHSTNTFTGQHYWEVYVGQQQDWELGLPQSYLKLCNGNYQIRTKNCTTALTVQGTPEKIGFYLNCPRMELSFYNADNMTHIHTVSLGATSFPVSAYFNLGQGSTSHCPITVYRY